MHLRRHAWYFRARHAGHELGRALKSLWVWTIEWKLLGGEARYLRKVSLEKQAKKELWQAAWDAAREPSRENPDLCEQQLNAVMAVDAPRARETLDARKAQVTAPAQLAEAQLGILERCTICGARIVGQHHRCTAR